MLRPGDLVRCKMLGGIYTPLGIIIREANLTVYDIREANPTVYKVFVMHNRGPNRQRLGAAYLDVINASR